MEKLRKLFFDKEVHKYTDEYKNVYTSMTTCIEKYTEEFKTWDIAKACARIGTMPSHPKYEKYKGKSAKQLVHEWEETAKKACEKGNNRHDYLEDIINKSNGFIEASKRYTKGRIYTIQDIMIDHDFGRIDIDYFSKSGLKERYPDIYKVILSLHDAGFYFYAELGVFDENRLISGLVDLPAFNHTNKTFIVVDWKTNKNPIVDKSGYFDKDVNGNETGVFIPKNSYFYPPIDHLPDSMLHKYSLQVSGYAVLIERYGYKNKGNIICHIRDVDGVEQVNIIIALDLIKEANTMFNDFHYNSNLKTQKRIFYE